LYWGLGTRERGKGKIWMRIQTPSICSRVPNP
jgi:hypothetical protein